MGKMNNNTTRNRSSKFNLFWLLLLFICIAVTEYSCSSPGNLTSNSGGSGTGVGNGFLSGKIIHPDSTPVNNATVRLRSESYLADTSGNAIINQNDTVINTHTDEFGNFRIDSLMKGKTYYIEVLHSEYKNADSGTLYIVDYDSSNMPDSMNLETRIIQPVKELEGTITISGLPRSAYIQVYGLERIAKSNASGNFELDDLPVGHCEENECEYKLRVTIPQGDGTVKTYDSELEIEYDINNNIIKVEFELEDNEDGGN